MIVAIGGIEVEHWNPRSKHLPRPLGRLRYGKRTNNFGDLLGPVIVRRLAEDAVSGPHSPNSKANNRLLTVGSIMHLSRDNDVIWGTGINGKDPLSKLRFSAIDVRAVRGPKTAEILSDMGIDVPDVFGDPALLIPQLFPELIEMSKNKTKKLAVLPNLHDESKWKNHPDLVSPRGLPKHVIREIIQAEYVVTSSLHGLIIAEIFGVPVQMVRPSSEPEFKYRDYIEGTGRKSIDFADSVVEAWRKVSDGQQSEPLVFDSQKLVSAFPIDLWKHEN